MPGALCNKCCHPVTLTMNIQGRADVLFKALGQYTEVLQGGYAASWGDFSLVPWQNHSQILSGHYQIAICGILECTYWLLQYGSACAEEVTHGLCILMLCEPCEEICINYLTWSHRASTHEQLTAFNEQ